MALGTSAQHGLGNSIEATHFLLSLNMTRNVLEVQWVLNK